MSLSCLLYTSTVSPSVAKQATPKAAPSEPEREIPAYAKVPLPQDDEEIDPPLPPPPKPRFPRSGKKGRPQAKYLSLIHI